MNFHKMNFAYERHILNNLKDDPIDDIIAAINTWDICTLDNIIKWSTIHDLDEFDEQKAIEIYPRMVARERLLAIDDVISLDRTDVLDVMIRCKCVMPKDFYTLTCNSSIAIIQWGIKHKAKFHNEPALLYKLIARSDFYNVLCVLLDNQFNASQVLCVLFDCNFHFTQSRYVNIIRFVCKNVPKLASCMEQLAAEIMWGEMIKWHWYGVCQLLDVIKDKLVYTHTQHENFNKYMQNVIMQYMPPLHGNDKVAARIFSYL